VLRWFANRSFRFKLSLATLVALLAMLGLLVWQTWLLLDAELRSQLKSRIDQTNVLLTTAVALPLAQRDYATLGDIASQSVARKTIDYVVVDDHRHRRVAAAGWPADKKLPAPSADGNGGHDGRVHVRQTIHFAGQNLGEVHYGVSLKFLDTARGALASKMLRIGAIGVLFGLLLLVPLGSWVTRRLGRLESAAQRLAAGKLDERIHLPGTDELSRLAGAFNHMADSLAAMIANLSTSEARFHHAVQGSSDGIWDWDLEHDEYYFSPRHKSMLGYAEDEIANDRESMMGLVNPEDRGRMEEAIRRHFEERQPFDCEFRMRHKDGHFVWCRSRGQALWDNQGRPVRFSGATSDITDQKQAAVALEHLAHYDALTQLPNRTLLADRLAMALAQARRGGDRVGVALLDLDDFKPVNDAYGHDAGDLVLVEVAGRLRASLRETDTVARLGGDEFVLVLSGVNEAEHHHTLTRLLDILAAPYPVKDATITLSASIGVTFFPEDAADPDTLLRHADQAMYVAKQAGRNRYHVFDALLDRDVQAQSSARQRIIAALAADEFRLHYQPKVDLRQGRVIGAEALIRWQHPELGLLPPAEFLPLIAGSDFDLELSEWVINTALSQLESWQAQGLQLDVSVNLPARHLQDAGFPDFLKVALARHPGAAARFELEVLESAALEDVIAVSERMEQCRRLGVRFSLDDFGTGYASLAYLRRLPIELLKIDQSFVRDMLQDPDDMAIVEGVIGLAAAFHDSVIAEGVETMDHAVMLLHLGCDLAQGNGISRPMPPEHMADWVRGWTPDPALVRAAGYRLSRHDLPLLSLEVEHRRWIDTMAACVLADGRRSTAYPPMDTDACRFGHWLHREGVREYGELEDFRAIDPVHEKVHASGRELIALLDSGDYGRARELLPQLFGQRDELLRHLHALIAVVGRSAHGGH
jgi:diguanylate cyclase (GGDEF)-like protein/PAS domain S-box-containing protein